MALDEPVDTDKEFDENGFKFLMDTAFFEKAQPVKIDFSTLGFKISSSIDLGAGGCSSCGSDSACSV